MFTTQTIPLRDTGLLTPIMQAYVEDDPVLRPFYRHRPDMDGLGAAIEEKRKESIDRATLVSVLEAQYTDLDPGEETIEAIRSLGRENVFCAVTAHQLNLCSGPLYVVYKTLSVIYLCRSIEEKNKIVCRPVFWLGSEDHDLAEVDHFHADGERFHWETDQTGAVGRMSTTGVEDVLERLSEHFGAAASDLLTDFRSVYTQGRNMAQATRHLLHHWFGHMGLIIVDGDHPAFKQACADIIRAEWTEQAGQRIVQATLERLTAHFPAQAVPRENNLFLLSDGVRERIDPEEAGFRLHQTQEVMQTEALERILTEDPGRFSPNVILRPLFQQRVLPSIAYVGGGGELAYWLQLQDLFAHHGIAMPVLVLRRSLALLERPQVHRWHKIPWPVDQWFRPETEQVRRLLEDASGKTISLEKEQRKVDEVYRSLAARAAEADPTLEAHVLAKGAAVRKTILEIEKRITRAEKQRHAHRLDQWRQVRMCLWPQGQWQERHDNVIPWLLRHGSVLFESLLPHMDPLGHEFVIALEE